MAPPDDLTTARRSRDSLRDQLSAGQEAHARAMRALREAQRAFGDDSREAVAARAALERAAARVEETRRAHSAATLDLHGFLRDRFRGQAIDEFASLSAHSPLVLLPVRLETRFALGGRSPELWIRVYPDEIHGDGHEPGLTDDELSAGAAYWNEVWDDAGRGVAAWRVLVDRLTPTRAAWVARALTPSNLDADHAVVRPQLPALPRRIDPWTRAVEARLLPDRWVAIGMRNGVEVKRHSGSAIIEPLALTAAPDAGDTEQVDISGDGLLVDEGARWTVDFQRALEVGMAITMPLTADDVRDGFDELLVLGVKVSLDGASVGDELARLFDAHHYQRGLALVRQGTPTNNTIAAPSGYPPSDPDALASFAVERDDTRTLAGRDGERLARALGVRSDVFRHVDRSDADEQAGARAMCGALWPATWGYFFEELLFEDERDDDVERFRQFFIEHVRARGPLPAFRIGGTPYGVVVTSSLSSWAQRDQRGLMQLAVPRELRRLREFWRRALPRVPRVGGSNDPDRELLDILEADASARDVRVRTVLGPDASVNMAAFFGLDWSLALAQQVRLAQDLAARFGNPGITSRVFSLIYGKDCHSFTRGFVVSKPRAEASESLSEIETLQPFNYVKWLREAPAMDDVRDEKLPTGVSPPNTLLYLLLRHAMLREAARSADLILVSAGIATRAMVRETEFPGAAIRQAPAPAVAGASAVKAAPSLTPWQRMQTAVPGVTGEMSVADFVWSRTLVRPENQRLREFREYLRILETLPTAELERLLTETLDACSTRLDAWVTALFTDRLTRLRQRDDTASIVGGFGWVTGLRAKPSVPRAPREVADLDDLVRRKLELPRGATLEEQTSTGGHIHAASMAQAATAAILRNGYVSRRHVNGERYGVDLSSTRVRRARWILDAVRNGQPLGAVLGYQFERQLHEGHPGRDLDKYIEPFRAEFPLSGGQLTPTAADEPVETVTARNVVNGLKLHTAFKAQPQEIAWGHRGLPPTAGADFDAVNAELRALHETIDAVSDLLLAESVYQLVRGNTAGASASLDSLSRGARPPDPEVIRSPRGGSTIIHRVALALDPAATLPASWAGIPVSPRSTAEPCLDAWLASLIGDPGTVRCAVTYHDAGGPVGPVEVTLRQLNVRAIDALYLLTSAGSGNTTQKATANTAAIASEIDARITGFVLALPGADSTEPVVVDYAPSNRATRSFPEIAEVLSAVQAVLSTARSLTPDDFVAASQRPLLAGASIDSAELTTRATAARTALTAAHGSLTAAIAPLAVVPPPVTLALRTAVVASLRTAAAFGVARAWVPVPHDEPDAAASPERVTELVSLAKGVAAEMQRRIVDATAASSAQGVLDAVFGSAFRTTTRFVPPAAAIDQALAAGPTPTPSSADRREWLRGAALVRPPLDRWLAVTRLTAALGRVPVSLAVTQVPHTPGAPWVALPFGRQEQRPESGTVGLAFVHDLPVPAAGASWVGLLLDEWTELIPNREESTAVAFHYDDPGAEAPQAVLIAVAPDDRERWSLDTVRDVLVETLEMARLRAVDRDLLGELEQLLPATFLAANPRRDTVSTAIARLLSKDRAIVERT